MRIKLSIAVAALVVALGAGVAAAGVTVYDNDVSSRGEFRAMKKLSGGKACTKSWRNRKALGFTVKRGKRHCALRTPVFGEGPQPNQELKATARLTKATPGSVAKRAYVGLKLRASAKKGYELRLFPEPQRFVLFRSPGGDGFPITGTVRKAVRKFPRANRIALRVKGGKLIAKINGAKVVDNFADPNPLGEVSGTRTAITYGSARSTRKDAVGWFDDIKVGIPGA